MTTGCMSTEKNSTPLISPKETQSIQTTSESSSGVITPMTTSTTEPWVTSSLWDGSIMQPPKELGASVSADKDALTHKITVTYNGGAGQQLIKDLQVRTVLAGGKVGVSTLGKNKGDSIIIQGTNKTDRIQAAVYLMDNKIYKIYDENLSVNRTFLSS